MGTTEQLTGLDRWTLRLWRVANVVGWSLAALTAAVVFRLGIEAAAGLFHRDLAGAVSTRDYVAYTITFGIPASLLGGSAIGTVVGAHVYRRAGLDSGLVSALFAAGSWWVTSSYAATGGDHLLNVVTLLLVVPTSVVVARRVARGRPRALSQGSG